MNRGQSFVAYAQSPKLMQPSDSAFDYPPGRAKIAVMRCSAFGNLVLYATLLQRQAVGTAIVGTIGLYRFGLFQWPPSLSSN
jgi:acetyl esterase/lipase